MMAFQSHLKGGIIGLLSASLLMLLFLSGCQALDNEFQPAPDQATPADLSNIPSISELLGTPAPEIPSRPALNQDDINLGMAVYEVHCASCHGQNLEGEPDWQSQNEDGSFRAPPHDDGGHTWHHSDEQLIESIRLGGERLPDNIGGTSPMPSFKDVLTEEEILAVLIYIKSRWPEEIQAVQWELSVRDS